MVEANQQISELEALPDWKVDFYWRHVVDHLERKAQAIADARKG